jgi:hypothetical protein
MGCDKCQHGDNEVTAQLTTIMQIPIMADGSAYTLKHDYHQPYVDGQSD